MSVQFTIAKEKTKDLEGGYWNDPSAGHTYAGITYKYNPNWPGWKRLFQLATSKYGSITRTPRYAKFDDEQLNKLIADYYFNRYWNGLMSGNLFRNQDIANFVYDFLLHKENDAVAVINYTAKQLQKNVAASKAKLSAAVITVANNAQEAFYNLLRRNRELYYRSPKSIPGTSIKSFSKQLADAFIRDRVNKFPAATKTTLQFPSFTLPWQSIKS
ncbi:glycosyl hydrolase family 108 [Lacibacter cauensis]|uniref:Glycosyl hydrolase family 108 n=1 Tax=Lacibacter cauensis TaxID=510947 RepID=A0A562SHW2_9BACT|nr:glycosyl hydrolase 108 family protein [Lacibacter cauensis]TWI80524.1 glycosyl hydrolase family 108 [Lacibacter cauensis]